MLRSIVRSVRLIHPESKSTLKIGSSFSQIAPRRNFSQGQNGWRQSSGNGNQYNATFSPSSASLIATVSILGTTACGLLWLAQAEDDRITSIDSLHDATKWLHRSYLTPNFSLAVPAIKLLTSISEEERAQHGASTDALLGYASTVPVEVVKGWLSVLEKDKNVDAYNVVAFALNHHAVAESEIPSSIKDPEERQKYANDLLAKRISVPLKSGGNIDFAAKEKLFNLNNPEEADDVWYSFWRDYLQGSFLAGQKDAMIKKFYLVEWRYNHVKDGDNAAQAKKELIDELSFAIKTAGGLDAVKSWFKTGRKSVAERHFPLLTSQFLFAKK